MCSKARVSRRASRSRCPGTSARRAEALQARDLPRTSAGELRRPGVCEPQITQAKVFSCRDGEPASVRLDPAQGTVRCDAPCRQLGVDGPGRQRGSRQRVWPRREWRASRGLALERPLASDRTLRDALSRVSATRRCSAYARRAGSRAANFAVQDSGSAQGRPAQGILEHPLELAHRPGRGAESQSDAARPGVPASTRTGISSSWSAAPCAGAALRSRAPGRSDRSTSSSGRLVRTRRSGVSMAGRRRVGACAFASRIAPPAAPLARSWSEGIGPLASRAAGQRGARADGTRADQRPDSNQLAPGGRRRFRAPAGSRRLRARSRSRA
jgi:hypothetical protein